MLYNPEVEIATLKQKASFVGLNSPKVCFMLVIIFPTFILLFFGLKVGDLVYCLEARKDYLHRVPS